MHDVTVSSGVQLVDLQTIFKPNLYWPTSAVPKVHMSSCSVSTATTIKHKAKQNYSYYHPAVLLRSIHIKVTFLKDILSLHDPILSVAFLTATSQVRTLPCFYY